MSTSRPGSASAFASIDNIPVIVWEVDIATFRFVYVSAFAETMLGFPIEKWYTDADFFWNQIHSADRARIRAECLAATARGEDHVLEYRMVAADGRVLSIRDHARICRDVAGRPVRLVGVMFDVTNERRTQRDRDSISRAARLLIEASSLDVIYRDLPQLLVENSDFSTVGIVLGRADSEKLWCVGAASADGLHFGKPPALATPLEVPAVETISGDAIRSGRTVVETDLLANPRHLHPLIRGQKLDTAVCVPLLADGRTIGSLTVGTSERHRFDPSSVRAIEIIANLLALQIDRHETQRALRVREQALEACDLSVVITDQLRPGTPIVFASPAFERLLGRPASPEIVPAAFLHKSADPAVVAECRAAMAAHRPCNWELDLVRGDGWPLRAAIAFAPVRDASGHVTHHVAIFADVTERQRLETELARAQKLEALGRLAGGIAHDFNNLLTVVVGYGDELLRTLPESDPARADVEEIRKAGERGARLTRQLLAFSRNQESRPQVLDLNEILGDMRPMFERLLREDVHLSFELADGALLVRADRGQLEQVVMNLVLNARDAMPRGGRLTIATLRGGATAHGKGTEKPSIDLVVGDSGLGMDKPTRSRMFDPFFTTKEQGTGLGLATVYGIVRQTGGSIDVKSAPDRGTTVIVRLPAAEPAVATATAAAPPEHRGGGETILLVEDDPLVRRVSRDALRRAGFRVVEASRGDEALAALAAASDQVNLVVSDIVMPGMSGIDLARRVQKLYPGLRFVFVSGFAEPALAARRPAGGILLQKPFGAHDLVQAIRTTLDRAPGPGVKTTEAG
jgi:signal transduction histidine kinase/ActR/RegA family two-component response regulator